MKTRYTGIKETIIRILNIVEKTASFYERVEGYEINIFVIYLSETQYCPTSSVHMACRGRVSHQECHLLSKPTRDRQNFMPTWPACGVISNQQRATQAWQS